MAERATMTTASTTVLDLYDGAYGPTLRIDVQSREQLVRIRDILALLARGALAAFVFADGDEFRLTGLAELRLQIAAEGACEARLQRMASQGTCRLVWVLGRPAWWDRVGLIQGLMQQGPPGHQYLSAEGVDDVLVEVAYGE